MQEKISENRSNCENLGSRLADILIKNGALEILAQAEKIAFKEEMPERI